MQGALSLWRLTVRVVEAGNRGLGLSRGGPDDEPLTTGYQLELTPQEQAVIDAYFEPFRRGRQEPATHREVAERLHYGQSRVREILYGVWAEMERKQIPMPDVDDKRQAVIEAAQAHGLVSRSR